MGVKRYTLFLIILIGIVIVFNVFVRTIGKPRHIMKQNVPKFLPTKNRLRRISKARPVQDFHIDPRIQRSLHTCTIRESCLKDSSKGQPRLPEAIIIGQAKCGTTALMWFLQLNPYIKTIDEPDFFRRYYDLGLDYYCNVTSCADDKSVVLDKSPMYYPFFTHSRIFKYDPNIKLLLLVREPFERLLSHLAHFRGGNKPWKYYEQFVFNNKTMKIKTEDAAVRFSSYYM